MCFVGRSFTTCKTSIVILLKKGAPMSKFVWVLAGLGLGAGVYIILLTNRRAARLADDRDKAQDEDRWQNEGGRG